MDWNHHLAMIVQSFKELDSFITTKLVFCSGLIRQFLMHPSSQNGSKHNVGWFLIENSMDWFCVSLKLDGHAQSLGREHLKTHEFEGKFSVILTSQRPQRSWFFTWCHRLFALSSTNGWWLMLMVFPSLKSFINRDCCTGGSYLEHNMNHQCLNTAFDTYLTRFHFGSKNLSTYGKMGKEWWTHTIHNTGPFIQSAGEFLGGGFNYFLFSPLLTWGNDPI